MIKLTPIEEHIEQIRGVSYGKKDVTDKPSEGYTAVLRSNNIQNSEIILEDLVYVKNNKIKSRQLLKAGDILITASTGSIKVIGKNAQCKNDINGSFGAFCKVVRSKNIDHHYLKHMFQSTQYFQYIQSVVNGANINNIKNEHIDSFKIPLPPLKTQKRIATILDDAQALKQKTEQLLKEYDALAQSIFLDMFGDPVTNPKGWEKEEFGKHISVLSDYHANGSYKTLSKNVTLKDKVDFALMIRTTDLENKNFSEGVKYIDEHAYNYLEKTKIYGGEIIMNKIGSAGKVYLMPHLGRPVSLGMNAFMIRLKKSVNIKFIYFQLLSDHGEREIKQRVKGAVTKTIRKDAVREIPIIIPPLPLQNQFAEKIKLIEEQKELAKKELKESEDLFQALLQKAFKGELV